MWRARRARADVVLAPLCERARARVVGRGIRRVGHGDVLSAFGLGRVWTGSRRPGETV